MTQSTHPCFDIVYEGAVTGPLQRKRLRLCLAFDQLKNEFPFDDSINQSHQSQLRSAALRAFHQAQQNEPVARPVARNVALRWSVLAASVVVCLLALATYWERQADDPAPVAVDEASLEWPFVEELDFTEVLAQINVLREESSPDTFFHALEIVRLEQQARQIELESWRMRWLHETSF